MAKPKSTARTDVREAQRAWLRQIVDSTGKSLSQIAAISHVSASTLTRFNRDDHTGTLASLTLQQIAEAMNVPPPKGTNPVEALVRRLIGQRDAEPMAITGHTDPKGAVQALVDDRPNAVAFRMVTRALELRGYLPGDILIVDMDAEPHEGDIVAAQVLDFAGSSQIVMRVYEKLVLTAATLDQDLQKPLIIDGERVVVVGVVTDMTRIKPR